MTVYHYLIVGNGAAGLSAAEVIRQRDRQGRITIVTSEPYLFYSRPGIAYYLSGMVPAKQLISRTESFYRDHGFNLKFGTISRVEPDAQLVYFSDGQPMAYDVLLLATGSSAVPPPFPGGDLDGVVTFDTMNDAKKIIQKSRKAKSAVVVGGGITAMELAEGLRHRGVRTTLLQRGDRIWPRLFDERESGIIEEAVRQQKLSLMYHEEISEIIGKKGKVIGALLKSGKTISCQIVGVAIGVRPNLSLVEDLSIDLDRGIIVNPFMQSSIDNIFAAGDVAQVYDHWTGKHNLDVLWPSAINEGRAAGYNMIEIARGKQPQYAYQKGSPFNAALLFGVHLSVIGRVGGQSQEDAEELSFMSRGSSNVWTMPFTSDYRSAWDKDGENALRVVMSESKVVGALLMGEQELADPLRHMIEGGVDLSRYQDAFWRADRALPREILKAWRDWHQSWQ